MTGDFLVIPRGAKHLDAAKRFLGFATGIKPQADFAVATGYTPVNLQSLPQIPADLAADLPSAHRDGQITLNFKYWRDHGETIAQRWNAWQAH